MGKSLREINFPGQALNISRMEITSRPGGNVGGEACSNPVSLAQLVLEI